MSTAATHSVDTSIADGAHSQKKTTKPNSTSTHDRLPAPVSVVPREEQEDQCGRVLASPHTRMTK